MQTVVFKNQGCALHADIYHPADSRCGTVLYLHSGALIWGSRKSILPLQIEAYHAAGLSVVAIDYRLAPETKLPQIVEDVGDALCWVKCEGPRHGLNVARLVVAGSSAGGYLSLLTGTLPDKPTAIVSFYGYGDIVADWYCRPSEFYLQSPLVSREEAYAHVGLSPIADGGRDRFKYYLYCRQQGIWTNEVSGIAGDNREVLLDYCPYHRADSSFPPTLLLHGDEDTDVPYLQSELMNKRLLELGVENRLITMAGKGHVFDYDVNDPAVQAAMVEVTNFLRKHII